VLYVPGLRNNSLSISVMENRGFTKIRTILICSEGGSLNIEVRIGFTEGKLYRLKDNLVQSLVHDNDNLGDLCHK
jgi:hypothetical protein